MITKTKVYPEPNNSLNRAKTKAYKTTKLKKPKQTFLSKSNAEKIQKILGTRKGTLPGKSPQTRHKAGHRYPKYGIDVNGIAKKQVKLIAQKFNRKYARRPRRSSTSIYRLNQGMGRQKEGRYVRQSSERKRSFPKNSENAKKGKHGGFGEGSQTERMRGLGMDGLREMYKNEYGFGRNSDEKDGFGAGDEYFIDVDKLGQFYNRRVSRGGGDKIRVEEGGEGASVAKRIDFGGNSQNEGFFEFGESEPIKIDQQREKMMEDTQGMRFDSQDEIDGQIDSKNDANFEEKIFKENEHPGRKNPKMSSLDIIKPSTSHQTHKNRPKNVPRMLTEHSTSSRRQPHFEDNQVRMLSPQFQIGHETHPNGPQTPRKDPQRLQNKQIPWNDFKSLKRALGSLGLDRVIYDQGESFMNICNTTKSRNFSKSEKKSDPRIDQKRSILGKQLTKATGLEQRNASRCSKGALGGNSPDFRFRSSGNLDFVSAKIKANKRPGKGFNSRKGSAGASGGVFGAQNGEMTEDNNEYFEDEDGGENHFKSSKRLLRESAMNQRGWTSGQKLQNGSKSKNPNFGFFRSNRKFSNPGAKRRGPQTLYGPGTPLLDHLAHDPTKNDHIKNMKKIAKINQFEADPELSGHTGHTIDPDEDLLLTQTVVEVRKNLLLRRQQDLYKLRSSHVPDPETLGKRKESAISKHSLKSYRSKYDSNSKNNIFSKSSEKELKTGGKVRRKNSAMVRVGALNFQRRNKWGRNPKNAKNKNSKIEPEEIILRVQTESMFIQGKKSIAHIINDVSTDDKLQNTLRRTLMPLGAENKALAPIKAQHLDLKASTVRYRQERAPPLSKNTGSSYYEKPRSSNAHWYHNTSFQKNRQFTSFKAAQESCAAPLHGNGPRESFKLTPNIKRTRIAENRKMVTNQKNRHFRGVQGRIPVSDTSRQHRRSQTLGSWDGRWPLIDKSSKLKFRKTGQKSPFGGIDEHFGRLGTEYAQNMYHSGDFVPKKLNSGQKRQEFLEEWKSNFHPLTAHQILASPKEELPNLQLDDLHPLNLRESLLKRYKSPTQNQPKFGQKTDFQGPIGRPLFNNTEVGMSYVLRKGSRFKLQKTVNFHKKSASLNHRRHHRAAGYRAYAGRGQGRSVETAVVAQRGGGGQGAVLNDSGDSDLNEYVRRQEGLIKALEVKGNRDGSNSLEGTAKISVLFVG